MILLWIAMLVGACAVGAGVVAARRRQNGGVDLGTMSASWIAEQRAGEPSYYGR